MLDAEEARLIKTGKVTIVEGQVAVKGFEGKNATCRDVAVLAAVWAIGELQRELLKALESPGGGNIVV